MTRRSNFFASTLLFVTTSVQAASVPVTVTITTVVLAAAGALVSHPGSASAAPRPPGPPITPIQRPPRQIVYTVDSTADEADAARDGVCRTASGSCTLRAAVEESAGFSPFVFTISVPAGFYPLNTGAALSFANGTRVMISGAGSGLTRVSGAQKTRVVDIDAGASVSIDGVSIQTGLVTAGGYFGHWHGAGIHNHGTLVLTNSAVLGNQEPTTPSTGSSVWGGGGITNATNANATLVNVTLYMNSTDNGHGAAIENLGGTMRLNHVTVGPHDSDRGQVAVYNGSGGSLTAEYSIFSTAYPNSTPNCFGAITWVLSISNDGSCAFPGYDFIDAQLGALDYNRHALPIAATSPAVDAGPLGTPVGRDQIGQARPVDGNCDADPVEDLGAYEFQNRSCP